MNRSSRVTPGDAAQALASLMAMYKPCPACDEQVTGPIHRTSARLWQGRAGRARENGGTDPVSSVTAAAAEQHLAAIAAK